PRPVAAVIVAPSIGPSRPVTRPNTSTPGRSAIVIPPVSAPLRTVNGALATGANPSANATATYDPGATPSSRNCPFASEVSVCTAAGEAASLRGAAAITGT